MAADTSGGTGASAPAPPSSSHVNCRAMSAVRQRQRLRERNLPQAERIGEPAVAVVVVAVPVAVIAVAVVAVAIVAFAFFGYEMLSVDSSELSMSKMDGSWKELATDDVTIMYQFNKNGEFTEMRTMDDDGTKYGSMCTGTWELSQQGILGQCISMKYDLESLVVDGHNEETGEVYDESDPTVNEMKQTLYAKYQKENQEVDKYKGTDKVYGLNNLTFSNDTIKQNGISIMVKIGDINR